MFFLAILTILMATLDEQHKFLTTKHAFSTLSVLTIISEKLAKVEYTIYDFN